jgi:1,4-dihydroxy-2-naphthoate octaprenyltransferase
VVIAAYVHTQRLDAATIAMGVPSSLIIAAILSANNACDQVGDARAGRHTLAIALGPRRAHWPVVALVAAAFAAVGALGALGVIPVLALAPMLVAGVLAWKTLSAMIARGWSHATKGPNMGGISLVFVAFTLCLIASLALAGPAIPASGLAPG